MHRYEVMHSCLLEHLKRPAFYIVVRFCDDAGDEQYRYMSQSGRLFMKMDAKGNKRNKAGTYFLTEEEAKAVIRKVEPTWTN
jgi:hypothetical protein